LCRQLPRRPLIITTPQTSELPPPNRPRPAITTGILGHGREVMVTATTTEQNALCAGASCSRMMAGVGRARPAPFLPGQRNWLEFDGAAHGGRLRPQRRRVAVTPSLRLHPSPPHPFRPRAPRQVLNSMPMLTSVRLSCRCTESKPAIVRGACGAARERHPNRPSSQPPRMPRRGCERNRSPRGRGVSSWPTQAKSSEHGGLAVCSRAGLPRRRIVKPSPPAGPPARPANTPARLKCT